MKSITLSCLVFLLATTLVEGQSDTQSITIGKKEKIFSTILHESREIYLYQPEKVKTHLPLIIVFDGESLFSSVVSAVRFMNYESELPQMPEAIVVGVVNTDRNRDMPVPQSYGKHTEETFLRFLSEELIPQIKKDHLLNGHVVLVGHSQGGLFVSYALSQSPAQYSGVIALDAPLDVDIKVDFIRKKITELILEPGSRVRYASMESAYGWGKVADDLAQSKGFVRTTYPDENHESMPHKGIYDGLKFIYQGFTPPKKDMKLMGLHIYYQDISTHFGFEYIVPERVLLNSANRQIMNSRKVDALELIGYAEEVYGISDKISNMKAKAEKLPDILDPKVEYYLNHPKPTAREIKPYLGHWVGTLNVRQGQQMPLDMEITIDGKTGKMISVQPFPPYAQVESEIFFVDNSGKLVYGRKNRGAGLVISTAHFAKNGSLVGEEWLIGFTIPDEAPEDMKEIMKFTMENPNTFEMEKK